MLIEPNHSQLSIVQQCKLIGLSRSSYYHLPWGIESEENLAYMRLIDEQYLRTPFYGSRQMTRWLVDQGHAVNRKRVQRLMRKMGLRGTVPGPHTSRLIPPTRSIRTCCKICSSSTPTWFGQRPSPTSR